MLIEILCSTNYWKILKFKVFINGKNREISLTSNKIVKTLLKNNCHFTNWPQHNKPKNKTNWVYFWNTKKKKKIWTNHIPKWLQKNIYIKNHQFQYPSMLITEFAPIKSNFISNYSTVDSYLHIDCKTKM